MGLYFRFSIVLFYILVIASYFIIKKIFIKKKRLSNNQFKLISPKRYFRYVKLIFNQKVIYCIIIFSIISNSIVIFQNHKYQTFYQKEEILKGEAIIISEKQEKEHYDRYKVRLCGTNHNLYLQIKKKSTERLEYGDKIRFSGKYVKPSTQRNHGGFDNQKYLKSQKIYGSVKVEKLEVIAKNKGNLIFRIANQINFRIKQKIDSSLEKEKASILKGILLGNTLEIEEDLQENFRVSNISHVLAVSGMHITYLMVGIHLLFQSKIGKRKTKILIIIFLVFYMFLTGFSPSVVRAGMMGILVTGAGLFYRKNDIWTSIAISLFFILIYNPFLITNMGLQFSYLGTLGMIILHKNVLQFLKNIKITNRKWKYRFNRKAIILIGKIKEILAVTISAQLAILPVTLYHFNLFGSYFILTNLLVSVIIGPIVIIGMIAIISSFSFLFFSKVIFFILDFLIYILILIAKLGNLPLAKIYIPTPQIWIVLLYYFSILILNFIYQLYCSKRLNHTQRRVRNLIALARYKVFQNKRRYLRVIAGIFLLFLFILFLPKKLEIHFVDVGQGDSTFIQTPHNKTILIDGGGSLSKEFDVGKRTLLPYILDRGYTKIDYIFISHFDQDHVGGILTILQDLKVGKVIISKQGEDSENYQKFLKIIKEKGISVDIVKMGDRVKIEEGLCFDILWPSEELIPDNVLNNNSIVMKMCYRNFSMLFTGDIEEKAEEKILETYQSKENKLTSKVLKVAHHGSKTSSMVKILNAIQPKIAFIGVGKNNVFNHPSEITIENLKQDRTKIYRTDEKGEITLKVNRKGKLEIETIQKKHFN